MRGLIDEPPLHLLALDRLEAFDTVEADHIEASRRALGYTPAEFAEHLGWSHRKYQRCLEATRDDHYADRDVALAVRGLLDVLLGTKDDVLSLAPEVAVSASRGASDKAFCGGRMFPTVLDNVLKDLGPWTKEVTPHLLRLVANRAEKGRRITYGEAANSLEEAELTTRVWPRTLYGMPLGAICNALMKLGRESKIRVPLLSTIVVKGSGQPGTGVDGLIRNFVKQYESPEKAKEQIARIKRDRDALIAELQQEVFAFPHWPGVIQALGL